MPATRHLVIHPKVADLRERPLVSVIIPAYNGEATLDETLLSVRAQTYARLEILVVDDGSRDGTAAIVEAHMAVDPRVRLRSQANAGVAAARNTGLAEATGDYVAFVDADDVWRSDKIDLQLAAFEEAGDEVGLVYCWYALIDDETNVIHALPRPDVGEDLLSALARRNIVGNGSSAMVRRSLAASIGFDTSLRAANAEGCEDWKFYFAVAERASFALAPDFLVGYRQSPGNMSSDMPQMLRSRDICMAEIQARHPQLAPILRGSRSRLMRFMLYRAVRQEQWRSFLTVFLELCRHDSLSAIDTLCRLGLRFVRVRVGGLFGRRSPDEKRQRFLFQPAGAQS